MDFWQNLNFSSANEDGETECRALTGAKRILCLTGSGTRPLDMLLTEAEEVIALDVNPAQNALLALKLAAIERFEYDDLLGFLGIAESLERRTQYQALRPQLDAATRAYWDRHLRQIDRGVWHAGKWEKLLWWNAQLLRLFRGRSIDQLLSAPTLAEQERIWRERFDDSGLRRILGMIGRDWVWKWVMREPAGEFLPEPREVVRRLATDFARAAASHLFRESDFAMLIFRGYHVPGPALPLHLRKENYDRLREGLPRLRVVQGGLTDLTVQGLDQIDGFSLSDFGSYCSPAAYAACWSVIMAAAAPEARYCERIFMNDLALPFAQIIEDKAASASLSQSDRAIIYRIRTGMIRRP